MNKNVAALLVVVACGCSSSSRRGGGVDSGQVQQNHDGSVSQTSYDGGSGCTVDQPQSTPLALPDTNAPDGTQTPCQTDADCGGSTPHCVITADTADGGPGFCVESYVDTLSFVGFAPGATLTDTSKLISVCATLEHSWFEDLQIELISPDGKIVPLRQFVGRNDFPNTFFLGHPNYCDSDASPMAGTGYKYCWTAGAPTKMLKPDSSAPDGLSCGASTGCESWDDPTSSCESTQTDGPTPFRVIPAGSYQPDVDFSALQGAQLNGMWTFRITDLWKVDNGFLFDWSIQFDSSLVSDCSTIIE